ncbi:MAG: glycoside hydrolase family 2 TIM barrel-domain containing protein, partial [Bacteroidota bacterium]
DFRVVGPSFHLNGRPIFLRGGNIAFHRFLADDERARLPWTMDWVRKVFIDIPREHHFNFFRFHLGRAYHRWYDLADEHGLLLQDEWQFWNATGSNRAIETEFRQWIKDNGNHPSIVIWDPLNESSDDSIVHDIVPGLRTLDPTRPWESVDFHEQHPYIYSLGMTLNHRPFGFTRALPDLERSAEPVVVNEFLWWWFDSAWQPTVLMKDIVERWLGRDPRLKDIVDRQGYLAEELVGLFRRMRCAAIQPFVYLSNNRGPTAHWFEGPVRDLKPKPLMQALRNAFAPFGLSMEWWDRHVEGSQQVTIPVHVVNDTGEVKHGQVVPVLDVGDAGGHRLDPVAVRVPPGERKVVEVSVTMPPLPGVCDLRMELVEGTQRVATARRTFHIFESDFRRSAWKTPPVVLDPGGEVEAFLLSQGMSFHSWDPSSFAKAGLLFVNSFGLQRQEYAASRKQVDDFVRKGGTLVIQEPEFRVVEPRDVPITSDLAIHIARRSDIDKGGYDSYVFPEDPHHPLWSGLQPEHFRWFNGGVGGEIVSEYTVVPSLTSHALASCGLGLRIQAVFEVRIGHGRVIVSRIQIRGRLDRSRNVQDPFARRFDPVAARYLLNLLSL